MKRRITPMLRQQIKGQFKRSMAGQDIVDDTETQEFRKLQQGATQGVLGAQQANLNRQAMAAAGGGPVMSGQFAEANRAITQAGTDAVQKVAGEEAAMKNEIRQQRRAEALQGAFQMADLNMKKTESTFRNVATAAKLADSILDEDSNLGGFLKGLYDKGAAAVTGTGGS